MWQCLHVGVMCIWKTASYKFINGTRQLYGLLVGYSQIANANQIIAKSVINKFLTGKNDFTKSMWSSISSITFSFFLYQFPIFLMRSTTHPLRSCIFNSPNTRTQCRLNFNLHVSSSIRKFYCSDFFFFSS